jgi:hypothetical protein
MLFNLSVVQLIFSTLTFPLTMCTNELKKRCEILCYSNYLILKKIDPSFHSIHQKIQCNFLLPDVCSHNLHKVLKILRFFLIDDLLMNGKNPIISHLNTKYCKVFSFECLKMKDNDVSSHTN